MLNGVNKKMDIAWSRKLAKFIKRTIRSEAQGDD
jgi:hypothetical protein